MLPNYSLIGSFRPKWSTNHAFYNVTSLSMSTALMIRALVHFLFFQSGYSSTDKVLFKNQFPSAKSLISTPISLMSQLLMNMLLFLRN
jgi:hypothetical protein